MAWKSTGKIADGATLDRLWREGTLTEENLTPEKASAIMAHRENWKAGDFVSGAIQGAGHMFAQGVESLRRGMASPSSIPAAVLEGGVRGTLDLGQQARDLKGSWWDDPRRIKQGEDPGAVYRERLIEQRRVEGEQALRSTRSDQGWVSDMVTFAASQLGMAPENAAALGEKFAADPQISETVAAVADASSLVPAGAVAGLGRKAAQARRAAVAADAARKAAEHATAVKAAHKAGQVPLKAALDAHQTAKATAEMAADAARGVVNQPPGMLGKAAGAVGRAAGAVGQTLEDLVPAVEKLDKPLRVAQAVGGAAALSPINIFLAAGGGAAAGLGRASRGLERAAAVASKFGQSLEALAKTDPASRAPVWLQIAKDPDAPAWLKRAAASPLGAAAEVATRAGGDVAKGAAIGAGIGAGLAGLDLNRGAEDVGAAAGAGSMLGAGGAAAGRALSTGARRRAQLAHDKLVAVDKAITNGARPDRVFAAPDDVLTNAVTLEKLFRGAMPGGQDLNILLLDSDAYRARTGGRPDTTQVAEFIPEESTVLVNVDYRDPNGRLLHEAVGHALMSSVVANNPDIVAAFDAVLSPVDIARAKRLYALQLGLRGQNLRDYVAAQDARDPQWIYGELAADSASLVLREADVLGDTDRIFGRPAKNQSSLFSQNQKLQRSFNDPMVRDALGRSFKALREYLPGVGAKETAPKGAPMRAEYVGQHPAYPIQDLGPFGRGNDWFAVTDTGRVVQRPTSQIRRIRRSRVKEAEAMAPSNAPIAPHTDKDPTLKRRQTPGGRVERTGTKMPRQFYENENSSYGSIRQTALDLEGAIERGEARQGWYHQIGEGEGADYRASVARELGNLEAQHKEFIPVNFHLTNKNNLNVRVYSLSAFDRKAREWAGRTGRELSLDLWDGSVDGFRGDVRTYLENHRNGLPGETGIGQQKRDLINAFLIGGHRAFEDKNPLRAKLGGKDRTGIIRSYRLERLATNDPFDAGMQRPDHGKQLQNLSPAEPGVPKNERLEDSIPRSRFRVDPQTGGLRFHEAIGRTARDHKLGASVQVKDASFYADPKNALFLADDGNAGVAVTDYGDLVSVFKHPTSRENIKPLLEDAAAISTTLDAFDVDGFLPTLYRKFGFKPVARVPFSREHAPPGWPYELAGEPDVVLMVRDPNNVLPDVDEVYGNVRDSIPLFEDYGEAVAVQAEAKRKVVESGLPEHVRFSPAEPDLPAPDAATLPGYFSRSKSGKVKKDDDGNPVVATVDYAFLQGPLVEGILNAEPDPAAARKLLFGKGGVTSKLNTAHLDNRKPFTPEQQALYDKIVDKYSDVAEVDFRRWSSEEDVMQAIGWYSHVADKVRGIIPDREDRFMFLEFLGGTSPNTSVEQNFLYAIDLFNRWKAGELQQHIPMWDQLLAQHASGELFERYATETAAAARARRENPKAKPKKTGGYKWKSMRDRAQFIDDWARMTAGAKAGPSKLKSEKAKAQKRAQNPTPKDILAWRLFAQGAIPVRKNGSKYGVHTERVFQIMARTWERDTPAPKAPNFTGNLKGTRRTATIDVWAARFLRRLGYELPGAGPWRIQPKAEPGVGNSDFFFGQDVFDAAVRKIAERQGIEMFADDLQAVMWFAEKKEWERRGWSKAADLGDFRDYLFKMRQDPSTGHLGLEGTTLGSTSKEFFDSLKFPSRDVRLPTQEVPTQLQRAAERLAKAREDLANAVDDAAKERVEKRLKTIERLKANLEKELADKGPVQVRVSRGYE